MLSSTLSLPAGLIELSGTNFVSVCIGFLAVSSIAYVVVTEAYRRKVRVPHIPGPTGLPIVGNYYQLSPDPAETLYQWGKRYGGVYQVMLGNMPVIIVNSMQAAKDLFIGQGHSTVDRPRLYTFHSVLSTEGSSIGTNGWNEKTKVRRKVAMSAMNRPSTSSYLPFIDELTKALISDLWAKGKGGKVAIDPKDSISQAVIDLTVTLHWGMRLPRDPELFKEILEVEDGLSRIKTPLGSVQDYVPIVRWIPFMGNSSKAKEIGRRRLRFLNRFNDELEERIARGEDKASIASNCLKDPEAKLDKVDLMSISMSMVSGGLDTMSNTVAWTLGTLALRPEVQGKAYSAICKAHADNSWGDIEDETGVPYISALVKESLRSFVVLRLSLPRTAYRDIEYNGMFIPKGTTMFLNAWGCNRDESEYGADVDDFRPERFLEDPELPHAAYGFGTRMCAGFHLANRQLYILYLRLIWSFKIELSRDPSECGWSMDPLKDVTEPWHLAAIPPSYKLRLIPRNPEALEDMIKA